MTDPNKLTLLTPGFDRATGGYAEHGIPAPVVAQYLRENRIVAEKNDLNSLLFLLTPGVEASKAGTLISGLVAFKKLHDDNALLEEAIPEFYRRRPLRYAGVRLRDLCADMHRFFREADVSALQAKQFSPEHLPEIALSPHAAARALVRNDVDYLPIDAIAGRIATTPFVVYPPGIATIVPGERLTERAQPMIDYLRCSRRASTPSRASKSRSRASTGRSMPTAASGFTLTWSPNKRARKEPGLPMEYEQPVVVRPSRDSDVEAMLAIYRHHIRHGVEEGVDDSGTPEPDDLRDRRKNLRNHRLPHLVATLGGEVVGYAYVVLFRKRPAYRYTVKHSIYIHHAHVGHGIGRLLLQELIDICAAAGFRQIIGYIDADNAASLASAREVRLCQGRACCPASPIGMAAGPTPSWCSARSPPVRPRFRRRCRSPDDEVRRPMRNRPGRRCSYSRLFQRLLQILDQIVAVLEADGKPDKTFADTELGARLRRQPLMRGGCRMGHEALGVTEIV